ncbi:MAG TPA: hypothetical protein VIQ76_05515, partial [Propionibacteriaceae bacterium]
MQPQLCVAGVVSFIQIARRDGGLFDDHSESPTDFSTALMQKSLWPKGPAIEDSPRFMAAPSH